MRRGEADLAAQRGQRGEMLGADRGHVPVVDDVHPVGREPQLDLGHLARIGRTPLEDHEYGIEHGLEGAIRPTTS